MKNTGEKLLSFLRKSPTCFQAVETAAEMLAGSGYELLDESGEWSGLQPGGKYMVTRNQSSLIAFHIPAEGFFGFQIGAAHTDSPSFRVKPLAEQPADGHYIRLNTEPYGGAIYDSWMDRPLSLAGRLAVETPWGVEGKTVNVDRDLLLIPHVAIHMNREVNKGKELNAQTDMLPLMASEKGEGSLKRILAESAGVREEQILGADLFLYNRTPGMIWGADGEFVSAPRLDDLQCAFGLLMGFLNAKPSGSAAVLALFDNEEVGSLSRQGADSDFLETVLRRMASAFGSHEEDFAQQLANSILISADNAHAVHPNHPELSDAQNRVYMNRGIVLKYNGNQKYTTNSLSEGVVRTYCRKAGIECQVYANRSDMAGGSTLGNLSNRHVSLLSADIGLAQLAMHSGYETAGVRDTDDLIRLMEMIYSTSLEMENNRIRILQEPV